MRLAVTRPEEDAGRLAESLRALGHEPVLLPLLEIVFPERPLLDLSGVQALIATSRNGLRALAGDAAAGAARTLPLYAVGEGTAAFAEELGFAAVRKGEGTARDLLPLIVATVKPETGALLWLSGEHITFDLATVLGAMRFQVRREVVYEARPVAAAGRAFERLLAKGLDGAVLLSPRTAGIFADLLNAAGPARIRGLRCYCYSQAVAKPLEKLAGLRLSIASRPTEAALLALIAEGAPA
jgi:uroporphyrinogen-III synthase